MNFIQPLKEAFFTKPNRTALWVGAGLLATILIFHAGSVYGEQRARMIFGAGPEKGFRVFFAPPGFDLPRGFVESGHGAVGVVQIVGSTTFTLETPTGEIKTVNATNTPALKSGDRVIIVGEPDEAGNINAKVIRMMRQP